MDGVLIVSLVTVLLSLLACATGVKYRRGKVELGKISEKLNAVSKSFSDVVEAAKDDAISETEFQKIVDNAKEILR